MTVMNYVITVLVLLASLTTVREAESGCGKRNIMYLDCLNFESQ